MKPGSEEVLTHGHHDQGHRDRQLGGHHSAEGDPEPAQRAEGRYGVHHRGAQGVRIVPFDEEFATQMETARGVMRENRDVLQRLAE